MNLFKEIVEGIPGPRDVFDRKPGLLDQWSPNVVREASLGQRDAVIAALFLFFVVAKVIEQRALGIERFLSLNDVGDVDQLVLPGVQRDDLAGIVREHVWDDAA